MDLDVDSDFDSMILVDSTSASAPVTSSVAPVTSSGTSATSSALPLSNAEMVEHFQLCMKMAAENKITTKNAFGLHMIDYMQQLVNSDAVPDLQSAGMSIAVSAKIYALRVDCLYNDILRFHGLLQTLTASKSKTGGSKNTHLNMSMTDDDLDAGPTKGRKSVSRIKSKSFIASVDSITDRSETGPSRISGPHGNFQELNAAFNLSRNVPKLLYRLQPRTDEGELRCSESDPVFSLRKPTRANPFKIHFGFLDSIKKAENLDPLNEATEENPCFFQNTAMSTKPPAECRTGEVQNEADLVMDVSHWNPFNSDDDDGLSDSPEMPPQETNMDDEINSLMQQVSNLKITSDQFVRGVTRAVTDEGDLNETLLHSNSILQRIVTVKTPAPKRVKPTSTKPKKPREPLFAERDPEQLEEFFATGTGKIVKNRKMKLWTVSKITFPHEQLFDVLRVITSDGFALSDSEDDEAMITFQNDSEEEKERKRLIKIQHVLVQRARPLSHYFNKYSLKLPGSSTGQNESLLIHASQLGDNADKNDNISLDSEVVFRDPNRQTNLFTSLNDGGSVSSDDDGYANVHFQEPFDPFSQTIANLNEELQNKCWIDNQIQDILVPKPLIVKPPNVNYENKPKYVDTEKTKRKMWTLIKETFQSVRAAMDNANQQNVLFKDIYLQLLSIMGKEAENLSIGLAFVILLMLANENNLRLENIADCRDVIIMQD